MRAIQLKDLQTHIRTNSSWLASSLHPKSASSTSLPTIAKPMLSCPNSRKPSYSTVSYNTFSSFTMAKAKSMKHQVPSSIPNQSIQLMISATQSTVISRQRIKHSSQSIQRIQRLPPGRFTCHLSAERTNSVQSKRIVYLLAKYFPTCHSQYSALWSLSTTMFRVLSSCWNIH